MFSKSSIIDFLKKYYPYVIWFIFLIIFTFYIEPSIEPFYSYNDIDKLGSQWLSILIISFGFWILIRLYGLVRKLKHVSSVKEYIKHFSSYLINCTLLGLVSFIFFKPIYKITYLGINMYQKKDKIIENYRIMDNLDGNNKEMEIRSINRKDGELSDYYTIPYSANDFPNLKTYDTVKIIFDVGAFGIKHSPKILVD